MRLPGQNAKRGTTVAIISDIHEGSTVAPWMPAVEVADGGRYGLNRFQIFLQECWKVAEAEILTLDPDVIVFNGDLIQGANRRDSQLVTNVPALQAESVVERLGPICDKAKKVYFVKGTPFHEGSLSADVEPVAKQLGGEQNSDTGQYTWDDLFLSLGPQYVAHFAHSIGVTSIPQSEPTMPLRDLLNMISEIERFWSSRPNVRALVRSHRHRCSIAQVPPNLVAMVTPSWQLKGEFIYKKQPGTTPQIGYCTLTYDQKQGKAIPEYRVFDLPAIRVETL